MASKNVITVDQLQVLVTANTNQFRKEMAGAKAEITKLNESVNGMSNKMPRAFGKIGLGAIALGNILAQVVAKGFQLLAASIDGAVKRIDTLNNFPKVLQAMGVSGKDAKGVISKLDKSLQGLPTSLDAGAAGVQRFIAAGLPASKATDAYLAMNNALLATGGNAQDTSIVMDSLTRSLSGGTTNATTMQAALSRMPTALQGLERQTGKSAGELYKLYAANPQQLADDLVNLNKKGGGGLASLEEQARNATGGIGTSMRNVSIAITRGLASIMGAIGQSNISNFFQGVTRAINAVIPYVVAFVQLMVTAVGTIGSLFGKSKGGAKSLDKASKDAGKTVGKVAIGAGAVNDGLSNATGSAKKLKKELSGLAGFDEMNVLKKPDSSSSGGGGGGASLSGSDMGGIDLGENNVADKANKVEQILARVKTAFQTFKDSAFGQGFFGIFKILGEGISSVIGWLEKLILPEGAKSFFKSIGDFFTKIMENKTVATIVDVIARSLGIFTAILVIATLAIVAWNIAVGIFSIVTAIATGIGGAFIAVMTVLLSPIVLIVGAIVLLIATIIVLIKHWDEVKEASQIAWDFISKVWGKVSAWFESTVVTPIRNMFNGLWNSIKSIFSSVGKWFSDRFTDAKDGIVGAFNSVSKAMSSIWDGIKNTFRNGAEALVNFVKRPINDIINLLNGFIGGVNKIKIPGVGGVSIPRIPRLARGAVVDKPTFAQIGERGKEVVMPLENNTGWIDNLAQMITAKGGSDGSSPVNITVKIGEETILKKVVSGINNLSYMHNEEVINV